MSKRKGRAFGFIPVWVSEESIEARNWWADILFSVVAPIWGFFMTISGVEPEGFPVIVDAPEDQG